MQKTIIDRPIVFIAPHGNDETSELAAGGYSPFSLKITVPGCIPVTLTAECNDQHYYSIGVDIPSNAKVEVLQ